MGVARNVFPVGTNIGTLVPLIGSYQYSHSVFGCGGTEAGTQGDAKLFVGAICIAQKLFVKHVQECLTVLYL